MPPIGNAITSRSFTALTHALTNDAAGIVSEADARRIVRGSVQDIENASEPRETFEDADANLAIARIRMGVDVDTPRVLDSFRQKGLSAVDARLNALGMATLDERADELEQAALELSVMLQEAGVEWGLNVSVVDAKYPDEVMAAVVPDGVADLDGDGLVVASKEAALSGFIDKTNLESLVERADDDVVKDALADLKTTLTAILKEDSHEPLLVTHDVVGPQFDATLAALMFKMPGDRWLVIDTEVNAS